MKQLQRLTIATFCALGALTLVAPAALACGADKPMPAKTQKAAKPADVAIPVQGMTCGGCANKIQVALMKLGGVLAATVSFEDSKAVVHYDAALVTPAELVKVITTEGYKTGKPTPVKAPKRQS